MTSTEVLIVGGGPVGLALAHLLDQRGIAFTVLERDTEVPTAYRASAFHAGTLDLLAGTGITEGLLDMGLRSPVLQYRSWAEGKIAEFDHALLAGDTAHPYRLHCEQFKLSQFLTERLGKAANGGVLHGVRATAVTQDADGAAVLAEGPEGEARYEARYVVGADGASSVVRKSVGVEFVGFTYPQRILAVGTTYDLRRSIPDLATANYVSDGRNSAHIVRIPDLWRMSLPLADDVADDEAVQDDHIEKRFREVVPDLPVAEVPVRHVYRVHQRVAPTYREGRVLLVGDAAHVNNPKGGLGLNSGLHDAVSLADHLAAVLRTPADDSYLDHYTEQRREVVVNTVLKQTSATATDLALTDEAARDKLFEEWRSTAADPVAARRHLLRTSMISSLRECGMLPAA